MELLVRDARLTDIDRNIGLIERAEAQWSLDRLNDAADVQRKGCVALKGDVPAEPSERARWEEVGFTETGPRMRLALVRSAVAVC